MSKFTPGPDMMGPDPRNPRLPTPHVLVLRTQLRSFTICFESDSACSVWLSTLQVTPRTCFPSNNSAACPCRASYRYNIIIMFLLLSVLYLGVSDTATFIIWGTVSFVVVSVSTVVCTRLCRAATSAAAQSAIGVPIHTIGGRDN